VRRRSTSIAVDDELQRVDPRDDVDLARSRAEP
jgi:hypothetical protein